MWNQGGGSFGGPRGGWGWRGRPFGPFGGRFGGPFGEITPEKRALFEEAAALAHQLMAVAGGSQADAATLTNAKNILAQARTALAGLTPQGGSSAGPTANV
jgi:hypothetical protein